MRISRVLVLFTVALSGCGLMMIGPDAMRGDIADAAEEQQLHTSAAREATTLPRLNGEVDRHTSRMDSIMDDMGGHMASMEHCSATQDMMTLRDGMRSELDAHASSMHAMTDLGEARVELETHVGTMGTMLDDMGSMLDGNHCGGR